jgi:hypothetical protein
MSFSWCRPLFVLPWPFSFNHLVIPRVIVWWILGCTLPVTCLVNYDTSALITLVTFLIIKAFRRLPFRHHQCLLQNLCFWQFSCMMW